MIRCCENLLFGENHAISKKSGLPEVAFFEDEEQYQLFFFYGLRYQHLAR